MRQSASIRVSPSGNSTWQPDDGLAQQVAAAVVQDPAGVPVLAARYLQILHREDQLGAVAGVPGPEGGYGPGDDQVVESPQRELLLQDALEAVVAQQAVPGKVEEMGIPVGDGAPQEAELVLDVAARGHVVRETEDEEVEALAQTLEFPQEVVGGILR